MLTLRETDAGDNLRPSQHLEKGHTALALALIELALM
jgi:hypothetical protein